MDTTEREDDPVVKEVNVLYSVSFFSVLFVLDRIV